MVIYPQWRRVVTTNGGCEMTWDMTQNTSYSGMTQEQWDDLPEPVGSHSPVLLSDEELAELDAML